MVVLQHCRVCVRTEHLTPQEKNKKIATAIFTATLPSDVYQSTNPSSVRPVVMLPTRHTTRIAVLPLTKKCIHFLSAFLSLIRLIFLDLKGRRIWPIPHTEVRMNISGEVSPSHKTAVCMIRPLLEMIKVIIFTNLVGLRSSGSNAEEQKWQFEQSAPALT